MEMKRTISSVLCAILAFALCFAALPKGARAASYVEISGMAVSSGTPYYKDGATSSTDPGGWTAWFTGDAIQLRSIRAPATASQGIRVVDGTPSFSFVLLNNANTFYLEEDSSASAISGGALVFTGNGALAVQSGADSSVAIGQYGIEAGSIALQGGASLTAAGYSGATNVAIRPTDWSMYTVIAGDNMDGTGAVTVTQDEYLRYWSGYKYVSFTAIPQPSPGPTPGGPDVPKTGDDTPIALLLGLALLAGTGLALRRKVRRTR